MSIVNANMTTMRVCRIFGVPALFTPHRVSRQTVHFGLYQYDMQALWTARTKSLCLRSRPRIYSTAPS